AMTLAPNVSVLFALNHEAGFPVQESRTMRRNSREKLLSWVKATPPHPAYPHLPSPKLKRARSEELNRCNKCLSGMVIAISNMQIAGRTMPDVSSYVWPYSSLKIDA